jgi:hypothetical protein
MTSHRPSVLFGVKYIYQSGVLKMVLECFYEMAIFRLLLFYVKMILGNIYPSDNKAVRRKSAVLDSWFSEHYRYARLDQGLMPGR